MDELFCKKINKKTTYLNKKNRKTNGLKTIYFKKLLEFNF